MTFDLENLDGFQRPSRYMGGEINAVIKDESEVNLRVALTFPDVYEIGMSHVGLKILYGLINGRSDFWAERVMAPWTDREQDLRQKGRGPCGLESGRPLAEFDVIGFSLQYELSYTNVLNMLDLAGLPLPARERGRERPLVLGGGPCAFNPEPLADFFDVFFLGDAEAGLLELLDEVATWKKAGGAKSELLARLARRPGVYVPSFFEPVYDTQGRVIEIKTLLPGYERVRRAVVPDLDQVYFPDSPVVPFAKPVHDRLALEISRGCTRGCRFCQAGFIYRPVRERRPDTILNLADKALAQTGLDEVSLLSLSAGDYTCLPQLMTTFMDAYAPRHIALSLPSLRVKSLNTDMMRQIKRVRKTGFTLAPEAGTQRLRDVINKDLTEEDLVSAAGEAFDLGWRLIKLYFMIGLPTETEADVTAIADLARRVRAGTTSRVNVSFAAFVPKAHTPFQWERMLDLDQMRERMGLLRSRLKGPGLKPKWNQPASSLLEGVLARGDRRLGRVLRLVQARGARFDAWSEKLNLDLWLKAMAELGLKPRDYLRARDRDEVLPWSHLDTEIEADFFWSEREQAYLGQKTPDCRGGACGRCGVCDFEEVKPNLCDPERDAPQARLVPPPQGTISRLRLNYAKQGPARYLGHLETVDVFTRAFRRAGLDCRVSQGFHPQPRLVFATPLPVGLTSLDEYVEVELVGPPEANRVGELLRENLPSGFSLQSAMVVPPGRPRLQALGGRFRIESLAQVFDPGALDMIEASEHIWVTKKGKKELRRIDLNPLLKEIRVLTPKTIEITLLIGPNGSVRPRQALEVLFNLAPDILEGVEVVKLETLVESD